MYKNKFLKLLLLSLVIIVIISFSMFGCKTTTSTKTTAATTETTTSAESTASVTETSAATTGSTPQAKGISVPEKETKIDLWFQDWAGGRAWTDAWVKEFEQKYPTIKINVVYLPFEELNTKLFPSITAGNEADLLMFYDEWLLGKDPSKIFGAITPELYTVDELKKVVNASTLPRETGSDGQVYGIPFCTGANAAGILIHKDLFDEAGIDPKSIKDWNDVKEVAKKLTKYDSSGKIKRSGILFTYTESANLFLNMIAEQGAADKLLNPQTGEWNFNIPEAKNAIEFLKSFVDEKIFDPQSGDYNTAFPNKIGAMLVIGPWALGAWKEQYPDLKLDYINMPHYPGTNSNVQTVVSWASYAISKRLEGDKRNAALIFLKETIENPDYFNIAFSNGYWVGVPNSQNYINYISQLAKEGKAPNRAAEIAAEVASDYVPTIKLLPTKISEPELIRNIIYPEMQNVFIGTKTIDQMLDYLTKTLTQKEKEQQ